MRFIALNIYHVICIIWKCVMRSAIFKYISRDLNCLNICHVICNIYLIIYPYCSHALNYLLQRRSAYLEMVVLFQLFIYYSDIPFFIFYTDCVRNKYILVSINSVTADSRCYLKFRCVPCLHVAPLASLVSTEHVYINVWCLTAALKQFDVKLAWNWRVFCFPR